MWPLYREGLRYVLGREDTALFTVLNLNVQGGGRRNGGTLKSHFKCVIQKETGSVYLGKILSPMPVISQVYGTVEESRHRLTFPIYY